MYYLRRILGCIKRADEEYNLIENGEEELFVENMSNSAKHLDEFEEALEFNSKINYNKVKSKVLSSN